MALVDHARLVLDVLGGSDRNVELGDSLHHRAVVLEELLDFLTLLGRDGHTRLAGGGLGLAIDLGLLAVLLRAANGEGGVVGEKEIGRSLVSEVRVQRTKLGGAGLFDFVLERIDLVNEVGEFAELGGDGRLGIHDDLDF